MATEKPITEMTIEEAMAAIAKRAWEVLFERFKANGYYKNPRDQWNDMEEFGQCATKLKALADAKGIILNTALNAGTECK